MSHADTLDRMLNLLGRARYALDLAAGEAQPAVQPKTLGELADEIAALLGHPVTDVPEAAELYALRDFLDDTRDDDTGHPGVDPGFCQVCDDGLIFIDGKVTHVATYGDSMHDPVQKLASHIENAVIENAVIGGPGCDLTMVHSFHPDPAMRDRQGFDRAGHPPNCPANEHQRAKPVHATTPQVGKSSESATRTTTPGRRPGEGCDVCRCQACHELIARTLGVGPWQHLGDSRAFDHGAVPMNHAPEVRFHGVPYACDGCGASPVDAISCLAPNGQHTWRPLPADVVLSGPITTTPSQAATIRRPCNAPAPLVVNGGTFAGCEHTGDHDRHQLTVTWERT